MNHLAHSLIAVRSGGSIVGHLLGDFVKGRPEDRWDGPLLEGIRLHREVDAFTDDHPVFHRSRDRIRRPHRRFAGILVDLFYDHWLARRWDEFSNMTLRAFADEVYAVLLESRPLLPARMQRFTDYARAADLLVAYRDVEGIARALQGISRRLRRPNPLGEAVAELEREGEGLERDFLEFFPELLGRFGPGPA